MQTLDAQFRLLLERIAAAERHFQRQPGSVRLLAVSKTRPPGDIELVYRLGQRDFGENYLQEALPKIRTLTGLPDLHWHFIGHIQANKTRDIAEAFDWVHSVDRLKIAQRLNEQRPVDRPPLNICLQINLEDEISKGGAAPAEAAQLAAAIAELPRLKLRGLMCIPAEHEDFDAQRGVFARLRQLRDELNRQGHTLDTLSMGMSGDLEAAIAEGATLVRVGTAIFGPRS
jgi:pyridoxal phosphate enzyme (YggS family)